MLKEAERKKWAKLDKQQAENNKKKGSVKTTCADNSKKTKCKTENTKKSKKKLKHWQLPFRNGRSPLLQERLL